jgi:hypothetical protein
MLLAALPALLALVTSGPAARAPQGSLNRRALLGGAAAAAVGCLGEPRIANADVGEFAKIGGMAERPASLGSKGISAYEKLKLDQALTALDEVRATATDSIKPTLDDYAALPSIIKNNQLSELREAALTEAAERLVRLAGSDAALGELAAAGGKKLKVLAAAAAKGDPSGAAVAATGALDVVTDFAYGYLAAEKPLATYKEAPPLVPAKGVGSVELPVSGKRI